MLILYVRMTHQIDLSLTFLSLTFSYQSVSLMPRL